MNLSRMLFGAAEAVFDIAVIVAVTVIVSGHLWLDVTLWLVAAISLVGGIWLASRRRSLGSISE